ncbi:MAG: TetR/AcrR family transcriptional regulator [Gulosibacter sp.]|uniref:TetR/AcrR family transcriptional regulator n=1 Tax=Gulosibacter sp. TaxID=2817531 RepID=UPI003F902508
MAGTRRPAGRPRTNLLTRAGITAAARDLIVTRGADALTMTSLANELSVTPSALYNHADSKREILIWVEDEVIGEIDISAFETKTWVKGLEAWAQSYLKVLVTHRELILLLATQPANESPNAWRMYERVTTALVEGGWPIESTLSLIESLEAFIFGSALKEEVREGVLDKRDLLEIAPTYAASVDARGDIDAPLSSDALFRIGFYSILTWSAEQLGVDLPSPESKSGSETDH